MEAASHLQIGEGLRCQRHRQHERGSRQNFRPELQPEKTDKELEKTNIYFPAHLSTSILLHLKI